MAARLEKSISAITDKLNALTANVIRLLTISFERGILKQRDFLVPLFGKLPVPYQSLMIFAIVAIAARVTATFSMMSSISTLLPPLSFDE